MSPKTDLFSQGMPAGAFSASTGFRSRASAHQKQNEQRKENAARIAALQKELQPTSLSEQDARKLSSLAQSGDGDFFWQEILHFGREFQCKQEHEKASAVFAFLLKTPSAESVQVEAQRELDAILGKGHGGLQAEAMISSFAANATSYKMILPMLAGSIVGQTFSAAALNRLTSARFASLLTRGWGAEFISGLAGTALEFPVFAMTGRALSGATTPVGEDLARAAVTLSAIRMFAWGGNRILKISGLPPTAAGTAVRTLVPQAAMFAGLVSAHYVERKAGLVREEDGVSVTNILASMVSLGVGSHLAGQVLGPEFAAMRREITLRAEQQAKTTRQNPLPSSPGTLAINQGKVRETTARGSSWIRNPVLAPMWGMMTMGGGMGGPPDGSRGRGSSPAAAEGESIPTANVHRLATRYHGLEIVTEVHAARPDPQLPQVARGLQESLLDILITGDEEGLPLTGEVAEKLRKDGVMRNLINRLNNVVTVRFDADKRSIREFQVTGPDGLKLQLNEREASVEPETPSPVAVPLLSEIRPAAPVSPSDSPQRAEDNIPIDSNRTESQGMDCGLIASSRPEASAELIASPADSHLASTTSLGEPTWAAVKARATGLEAKVIRQLQGPSLLSARQQLKNLLQEKTGGLTLEQVHGLIDEWELALDAADSRTFGTIRQAYQTTLSPTMPPAEPSSVFEVVSSSSTATSPADALASSLTSASRAAPARQALPDNAGAYSYQLRIAAEIEALSGKGEEWKGVHERALILFQRLNGRENFGRVYQLNRSAANLFHILAMRDSGYSREQITELLLAFEQAMNGLITLEEIYRKRKAMRPFSWKAAAEAAAASVELPSERDSKGSSPFSSPAPLSRPQESPVQLALKRLEFLAQGKPEFSQVFIQAKTIYQRLQSPEGFRDPEDRQEAMDRLSDALGELASAIETEERMTSRKGRRLLDAFERALNGEITWNEFERFDFRQSSAPPPPSSAFSSVPAPDASDSAKESPEASDAAETLTPERRPHAAARESKLRFNPVSEFSEIRKALWDVLWRTEGEMQAKDIIQAVRKGEVPAYADGTLYKNLSTLADQRVLQVRVVPRSSGLPDLKFYSIPETVRRTLGMTPLQRAIMEVFLTERRELLAARVVDMIQERGDLPVNPSSAWQTLRTFEERNILRSRSEPNPQPGFPALRYYSLVEPGSLPASSEGTESGTSPVSPVQKKAAAPDATAETAESASHKTSAPWGSLQPLIHRIFLERGGELQVKVVRDLVAASGEWSGNPETVASSLRVMEKKGILASRTEPNPASGLPPLRFYRLKAELGLETGPLPSWQELHERAERIWKEEIEGRFEGRKLELAQEAYDLLFKFQKDMSVSQAELLLNAFEGDLSSGVHFGSIHHLLDRMLPFRRVSRKLKRVSEMGEEWREVAAEANRKFNELFQTSTFGATKREAGILALKGILKHIGQLAPNSILTLLRNGSIERHIAETPVTPPPPPDEFSEYPPKENDPIPLVEDSSQTWEQSVEPMLGWARRKLQDPELSRAIGVLILAGRTLEAIEEAHAKGIAVSQLHPFAAHLNFRLNEVHRQDPSLRPALEAEMVEEIAEILRLSKGSKEAEIFLDEANRKGLGFRPAVSRQASVERASPATNQEPVVNSDAKPLESVAAKTVVPEPSLPETEVALAAGTVARPVVPTRPATLPPEPPRPPKPQEVVELDPKSSGKKGLFGLGEAVRFFGGPKGSNKEGTEFLATLILPNLTRLSFSLLVESVGAIQVSQEQGQGLALGNKRFSFQVHKVEKYENRVRIDLGQEILPFDLDILPFRQRGQNFHRLELSPNQAAYEGDRSVFFSPRAPRHQTVTVLHHELLSLATGRGKPEYSIRLAFYLSNGDRVDILMGVSVHGSGKFKVYDAQLARLAKTDSPIELDVIRGSGSGGKNRIILGNKEENFLLEMDADIPSEGSGAVPALDNFSVKTSPPPVWVRLRGAPAATSETTHLEDAFSGDGSSSEPPSSPELDLAVASLAADALGGDLKALRTLGENGKTDAAAVRELSELFDIVSEAGASAEELGGIAPVDFAREILEAMSVSAQENSKALLHLTTFHSIGVPGALGPIFAVAGSKGSQAKEARDFLLNQASFGNIPVLEGLLDAVKGAGEPAWRLSVASYLDNCPLGESKNPRSLRSRMMLEVPILKVVQALADRGRSDAKEAIRQWNDFRHYEDQLEKDPARTDILEVIREVAKTNPRAAKFLRDMEEPEEETRRVSEEPSVGEVEAAPVEIDFGAVPQPASSPRSGPEISEAQPSEIQAGQPAPETSRADRPRIEKASGDLTEVRRILQFNLGKGAKKAIRGDAFNKIYALAEKLSPEEKSQLIGEWLPALDSALKAENIKKITLYLDGLHALDHHLDDEAHENLASQIRPWRLRFPKYSWVRSSLDCLFSTIRVSHVSGEAPIRSETVNLRQVLLPSEEDSSEVIRLKGILTSIHQTAEKFSDAYYAQLDQIMPKLESSDLKRLADEASEELKLTAQQSFLPENLDGTKPKRPFLSKVAVLANLLYRVLRDLGPDESAPYMVTLLLEPNLQRFNIDWLHSQP